MADEIRNSSATGKTMTEEGKRKLQERLDYLSSTRRQEIIQAIETARGFGDLSENAEYTAAREDQAKNEAEITRLEQIILNAIVVADSEITTDKVSVGTTVVYVNQNTNSEYEYAIVGADEANPENGSISDESPIGRALIGSTIGDTIEVKIPRGTIMLTILDIHR